jgi:ubiquitin-conjugating enzyme E2 M
MIKLFGAKGKRAEEEKKAEEAQPGAPGAVHRRSAGEIRLQKELNELDLPENTTINFTEAENIMKFDIYLRVDDRSSLWSGAQYHFTFTVPPGYPHEPPKVHCNTKIYHPNIDLSGNVCLNILRADWKPVLCISAVILGLNFLFLEPNPNDPLNHEAAELMRNNLSQFQDNVRRSLRGQTVSGQAFPRLL